MGSGGIVWNLCESKNAIVLDTYLFLEIAIVVLLLSAIVKIASFSKAFCLFLINLFLYSVQNYYLFFPYFQLFLQKDVYEISSY